MELHVEALIDLNAEDARFGREILLHVFTVTCMLLHIHEKVDIHPATNHF